MGGCETRIMKNLYIHRHDEAMRTILKAITRGKHGSFLKIADIGRDELVEGPWHYRQKNSNVACSRQHH